MENQYARTQLLLGADAMTRLRNARVAVFGIGGVGGYTVEALARCGIGTLDLVDHDTVSLSNINRQIIATHSTVGQYKVDVAMRRIADIDPTIQVNPHNTFFLPETADQFDFRSFDYVVDAIDTVTGKLELIAKAKEAGVPIISCMGTGNKLDPSKFEITYLHKTSVCPLARIMRKECHKRGLDHIKVLYSREDVLEPQAEDGNPLPVPENASRRSVPGSISFVPSVAGMMIAGEVIRDLIAQNT